MLRILTLYSIGRLFDGFPQRILNVLISILVFSAALYSQNVYIPDCGDPLHEPWRWTTYDELAGKGVSCIAESADGDIWFGINQGVIRYNGLEWIEYNSDNRCTGNAVSHLISGEENYVYAGAGNGLYVFIDEQWNKIFPIEKQHYNDQLQSINCLKKLRGRGVIASVGTGIHRGLMIFKDNKPTVFLVSQLTMDSISPLKGVEMHIVPDEKCIDGIFCVEEVFQDQQDRLWLWVSLETKQGHVFYINNPKNPKHEIRYSKNFTSSDGLIKGDRAKFHEDSQGNIWMVTRDLNIGISKYDGSSWSYLKQNGENAHYSITNIDGTLWIGGYSVLYTLKSGNWNKYQRPSIAIPGGYISVHKDKSGYLWMIGTQNEVIRIDYSNQKWASYYSLNFQCEDASKNLWFLSVDGKVVLKKENNWFYYTSEDGLCDAPVKIYCTKDGLICVAGSFNGQASISFFDGTEWKRQVFPEFSWGIDHRAIFEDVDGDLWIGSSVNVNKEKGHTGGLIRFQNPNSDSQIVTRFYPDVGILRQAYGIAQTKDKKLWVAGSNLNYFEDGQWNQFTDIDELTNYSNCLGNTPDGELWIGSRMSGVFWYNNNGWQNFTIENGLISNTIISIFPVDKQEIWIATDRDFSRYDGRSWTTDVLPEYFTLSKEGGDIHIQPDGTLWVNRSSRDWKRRALNNNIVEKEDLDHFATFSYKKDTLKPDTRISMYSDEIPSNGNTRIEWTGREAWKSDRNMKLQYSYRLDDYEWSEYSYEDNITFFNLKNGEHRFEVRARDMDFNVDPVPDCKDFVVLPPVWKQAWFIILIMVFVAIIIAYQFNAHRHNKYLNKLNLQLEKHSEEIERKNSLLEKQKDQILHQNMLEKERNHGKIRFFTNISHEFRTPLTIISGIAESLTLNQFRTDPSGFQTQLSTVKKHTNRLLRLINQLMDFRKMETDALALRISESDLVGFMHDIYYSFKDFAKQHHIKLVFSSNVDKIVGWYDRDKIEKISYNLISNAIKFTPEGGSIFVKVNSKGKNNTEPVEIIIEDTGKGITQNETKRIFEPFYQANRDDGSLNEGTGIGLSLVNNLVNLHHGKMKVISYTDRDLQWKNGFSTRFMITMSLNKVSYKESEIVISDTHTVSSIKNTIYEDDCLEYDEIDESIKDLELPNKRTVPLIVFVEDNNDLRRYMVNSLQNYYKVLEAGNGSEGFDLIVKTIPDLIISDIMMPQMSGTELCHKLRNDIRTSHIPVILLTARTTDENKMEGFQVGADDYITKPFSIPLLVTRINNIISTHISLRRKYRNEEFVQPDEVLVSSIDTQFLQKVKTVVEENYHDNLFGVSELSSELGMSGRHLLFKLQNLIETTPVEYIKIFRLKRAAQLLVSKKATISEIVYETGFNDPSYFGKCFTKYYGMNPSKYIKTYSKKEENL